MLSSFGRPPVSSTCGAGFLGLPTGVRTGEARFEAEVFGTDRPNEPSSSLSLVASPLPGSAFADILAARFGAALDVFTRVGLSLRNERISDRTSARYSFLILFC
eukprot:scaffold3216_cov208-Pinguiococcus_pyrenoidosus.AAC.1